MKIVAAYKWTADPQEAQVAADGRVDLSRARPVVSGYDAVAIEVGSRLAKDGGELVGASVGGPATASPIAVKTALARIDSLLALEEWHQASPRRTPHTFEVHLPAVGADGVAGGTRVSAATTMQIIADVARVSPARSHFDVVIDLAVTSATAATGAARAALYRRVAAVPDPGDIDWGMLITNEIGEPLTDDTGQYLDGSA